MVKCIHHWYLGASHNGVVHARCIKCGEEKDYYPVIITPFKSSKTNPRKAALNLKPRAV